MQECFLPSCLEIGLMELMHFNYFAIIFPKIKSWTFIWTNLNSLYRRMLCTKIGWNFNMILNYGNIISLLWNWHCAKFGWNCPNGSWEDENVKILHGRLTIGKPKSSGELKIFSKAESMLYLGKMNLKMFTS